MHLDYCKIWNGILAVLILYSKPVLAVGGDDFTNNLLSDLAPLIALFGEEVTRQYLSQSMHWLEHIIFACAPLGMVTAITCAIRVAGDKTFKAVIGRAREPRAQAEIEVMSSTSSDVCELWNGVGIVRLPGSPDVIELLYDKDAVGGLPDVAESTSPPLRTPALPESSGDVNENDPGGGSVSQGRTINSSVGIYRRQEVLEALSRKKDSPRLFEWVSSLLSSSRNASSTQPSITLVNSRDFDNTNIEAQNAPPSSPASDRELRAPNISLNTSNPPVSIWELWVIASIGVILQGGVLAFDALVTYYWRWGKNGTPVATYAFWCTFIGTLAVSGGMFICAYVIELSTVEDVWEPRHEMREKNLRIMWLQRGQTVSDQRFKSYAIYAAQSQKKMTTSRPLDDEGQYRLLTAFGTMLSIFGFIFQFVGLRGMNFWATLIQLLAMGIMTLLRVLLRRNLTADLKLLKDNELTDEPSHHVRKLPKDHELDFVVRQMTGCESWSLVTSNYFIPRDESPAVSRVLEARIRLGEIAGPAWLGKLHETVLSLAETIEALMNHLWKPPRGAIEPKSEGLLNFTFDLIVNTKDEMDGLVRLGIVRGLIGDQGDWGPWKANCEMMEAIISLWMSHLEKLGGITDEGSNLWIIGSAGYDGDVGRVLSDWWISREIDHIDVQNIEDACRNHKVHESRVLYSMNLKSIDETIKGIVNETSLAGMCAQFILSNFMQAVVREIKPIVSETIFEPIEGKRLLKIFNKDVCDLAEIIEKSGLATLDDAYRIVVPALFEADKLPNLIDKAPEILQISKDFESGDRVKDAKELCKRIRNMCIHRANTLITKEDFDQAREVCMQLVREFVKKLGTGHRETRNMRLTMKEFGVELSKDLIQPLQGIRLAQTPPTDIQTPPLSLHRAVYTRQVLEVYKILREIDIHEIDKPFPEQPTNPPTEPLTQKIRGKTPLALAVENGDKTLVKLLLSFGASAAAVADNSTKRTALHLIANAPQDGSESKRGQIVKLLLLNGADIDDQLNSAREAPLHLLAAVGDNAMVKLLVEERASLDIKDKSDGTPLHRAAEMAHRSVVEFLVDKGADIDVRDKEGKTATHRAAGSGRHSIVKYLVGKGSNPTIKDKDGETPIHTAAGKGHQDTVEILLEEGVDPDVKGKDGRTSMHEAAELNQVAILKLLLERGFDPDNKDDEGRTALHIAASKGSVAAAELLIRNNADPDAKDKSGKRATHRAAEMGHQPALEALMGTGCDPEARDIDGKTVLHAAAGSGQKSTSEFLMKSGINPDLKDKFGRTAMHFAAESGFKPIVKLFLDKGSDPDVKDHEGKTPLHSAAGRGHTETVALLLEKGANFGARDILGRTAMHNAAEMNHKDCVQLLIDQEIDMNTIDVNSETAMHIAAGKGCDDTVKLLIDSGADPNARDKLGNTPLHKAAEGGHGSVAKLLFASGVDPGARDSGGRTATKIAQDNEYVAVQRVLGMRQEQASWSPVP